MADDQAVTKVEISIVGISVTVEAPNAELGAVKAEALDTLRQAHALNTRSAGPAIGYALERDTGLDVHSNKRWGGEFDPVRAEAP